MCPAEKRAVIASAFESEAKRLHPMLAESGFSEIVRADNGQIALELVQSRQPDALLADAVLPVLDGTALIERVLALPLTVYPATLLMVMPGMASCTRRLENRCAVLEKPIAKEIMREALAKMLPERREIPPEKRQRADALLTALGVPEHPGRQYLLRAILIAWQDARMLGMLTTRLYPAIAEYFGVDQRHVERAMRHAIDAAWRSGALEAQYDLFGDTIDAKRGSPTCGEMIARIADILRWEGRA